MNVFILHFENVFSNITSIILLKVMIFELLQNYIKMYLLHQNVNAYAFFNIQLYYGQISKTDYLNRNFG